MNTTRPRTAVLAKCLRAAVKELRDPQWTSTANNALISIEAVAEELERLAEDGGIESPVPVSREVPC